jgi:hypothetical protein
VVGSSVTVGGGWVFVGGAWVFVSVGSIATSVGLAQPARIAIENRVPNISRNVLWITIPPFDLGIPQIIQLNNTTAFFRVDFNRLSKVMTTPQIVISSYKILAHLQHILL